MKQHQCASGEYYRWSPQILLSVEVHNEHIRWLHHLFLNAGGGEEDVVAMAYAHTAACACHPAKGIEASAKVADVVCWV